MTNQVIRCPGLEGKMEAGGKPDTNEAEVEFRA
jgi:hypothetical protein